MSPDEPVFGRHKSFSTVVNCMDGRVQMPVNNYARVKFLTSYVDTITEAGAVRFFEQPNSPEMASILERLEISINAHQSRAVAVAAHYDCAGNPVAEEEQKRQVRIAAEFLANRYPHLDVLGLWVNELWYCYEVCFLPATG